MMKEALSTGWMTAEQDRRIAEDVERERRRLRNFIRRRLPNAEDVEDVLQEVLSELVEAYRSVRPIEDVGAWLFRVARNRITDLFRKRKQVALVSPAPRLTDDQELRSPLALEDLLPSADGGPEVAYARRVLMEELDAALDELPEEQRQVFLAHEIEGRSFRELAAESGLSVNTLLARKHYAVLRLRRRLQAIHEEFMEIWNTKR
jgi:RNA polymerase sigma factor (sigma-70 family)